MVVNLWIIVEGVCMKPPRLTLFMRGISQMEPVKKTVECIWDPTVVLNMFREWPDNSYLSLLDLSKKCVTLIALDQAQRAQTLQHLNVLNITITQHAIMFVLDTRLKQTKGDRATPLLYLPKIQDSKVCVW